MVCSLESVAKLMVANFFESLKAFAPMRVTSFGIAILVKSLPAKASASMVSSLESVAKLMVANFFEPLKAFAPMRVTSFGIAMLVKSLLVKALASMVCSLEGLHREGFQTWRV